MESHILSLTDKVAELAVQVTNSRTKRDNPGDERPNVWCTNCKGQGHMLPNCPSPLNQPPECRFCGGHHDIANCNKLRNNLSNAVKNDSRNHQVYQIDDTNDQMQYNANSQTKNWDPNGNNNNGSNRRIWYNNRNTNGNQNSNPNFVNNNFNNGGYRRNPNRYIPNQN